MLGFTRRKEQRSIEDPRVPISDANIISFLGLGSESATGEVVTIESALGVPAIWAAVNFIPGTLAGLPLKLYRKKKDGREEVKGPLARILHDAVNDEMTSFDWRKYTFERAMTGGRGITFIERNAAGRVINLWPLDPSQVTIRSKNGRKQYDYRENGRAVTYLANEIIDIPFMRAHDMLRGHSPIMVNKDTVALAIAATKYGARFFGNGGVPPFVMTGKFLTPAGLQRASDDLAAAVQKSVKDARQVVTLPEGHEIKTIGVDPEKTQLVELQRFLIEQIARIYSLPPTFLQDLTNGTFANTEQQDLHFVKHTLKRWVEQFEQEVNLKLFGRTGSQYVEMNVDGMLRGDFKTRMEGYALGVQNAFIKPSEVRERENWSLRGGGESAFGAGRDSAAWKPADKTTGATRWTVRNVAAYPPKCARTMMA